MRRLLLAPVLTVILAIFASMTVPPATRGQTGPAPRVYLPLISKELPTATPTATTTPTRTPTPTLTPLPSNTPVPPPPVGIGSVIQLKGVYEQRLRGTVTGSQFATSLGSGSDYTLPAGIFVVVFLDMLNQGNQSDFIGSCLQLHEPLFNRTFDSAEFAAQWAARQQFSRKGIYSTLQPGIIYQVVVVFDVAKPGSSYQLTTKYSWCRDP